MLDIDEFSTDLAYISTDIVLRIVPEVYYNFLWPPCVADADIIFLPCGFFYLLSSFSFVFLA